VLDVLRRRRLRLRRLLHADRNTEQLRRVDISGTSWRQAHLGVPLRRLSTSVSLLCDIGRELHFDQFPYTLMRESVSGWNGRTDQPFPFYFHVWELDPEQPRISAASKVTRLRHYRKAGRRWSDPHENLALYENVVSADHLQIKQKFNTLAVTEGRLRPLRWMSLR